MALLVRVDDRCFGIIIVPDVSGSHRRSYSAKFELHTFAVNTWSFAAKILDTASR
jgi:hypothetical protein